MFIAQPCGDKPTNSILRKLEEWGDDDGFGPQPDPSDRLLPTVVKSRVVVLKHMFRLEDLEKDATLLLDLKEDVREECSMLGEVTNVTLYDVRLSLRTKPPLTGLLSPPERARRYHDCEIQGHRQCSSLHYRRF